MSTWISGFADKAENILNKLDQNAATALLSSPNAKASSNVTVELGGDRNVAPVQSLKMTRSPMKLSRGMNVTSSISDVGANQNTNTIGAAITPKVSPVRESGRDLVHVDSMVDGGGGENSNRQTPDLPTDKQELLAFKIALNEVTSERNELRQRITALNNNIEVAQLQQRVADLETLQERVSEERDKLQKDLRDVQDANNASVHTISELEFNLSKLQQEYFELAQNRQMQVNETERLHKELHDYRIKAQRALQLKENLIAELRGHDQQSVAGQLDDSTALTSNDSDAHLMQIEHNTLKQEHQSTLDEKRNLEEHLEQLRNDFAGLQKQYNDEIATLRSTEQNSYKDLMTERKRIITLESEHRVLAEELKTLRQQLSNQMAQSLTQLHEKDEQLHKLRKTEEQQHAQVQQKQEDLATLGDHASRIKVLTQSLIDKQNNVERLTVERNALRIQVEKLQDTLQQTMYANSLNAMNTTPRNTLLSNSTDDAKAQYPLLLRANPFDNHVARRMKRVYTTVDSAGIRLNAFLRRNPLMRIFVLVYVLLLHIWVIFVLLSTTPPN